MNTVKFFQETRSYLEKLGFPTGDAQTSEELKNEFAAGGHYGIELSSINNLKILTEAINHSKKYDFVIDRVDECRGIFRLPDAEIKEMIHICAREKIGLYFSIGPRAIYDIGGFVKSDNGKRIGYRLRGMENLIYAVEDVKRVIDFGARGLLIYDEGLLYVLNQMRKNGDLPPEVIFKLSVHMGCSNPLSAKVYCDIGADTVNIIPDLSIEAIGAFRKAIQAPIDVFTDTASEAGGFIRTYDIPQIILSASPVYLKCGPISQQHQNHLPSADELNERIKQTKNVIEHIKRYLPEAKQVSKTERTVAIPQI